MTEKEKIYYDLSDETLVSLTLLGDNQSFEELVIRYQRAVTVSVYSVTRNSSLADDIIQDSFVSAWLKLNTLKESQKFGAWICSIARNKAKNLVSKYQEHISFDLLENVALEQNENLEDLFFSEKEDYNSLYVIIGGLSDKLKDVVKLHYFENASVDEISMKLNLPAGTVKWRLHEGREKIRKGLGYMENNSKALAKSVLEKIKKVKAWYMRDNKEGFETDYNNAMTEIEKMPDTEEKYFNMAEIMQLGFWWLPGNKNDELIEKIKQAAEKGKNNTVLAEIWKREADKYHNGEKTDYILNTLIPRMETAGMTEAVGEQWFWLGNDGETQEKRLDAYKKVTEILPKHNIYHAHAVSAARCDKLIENIENLDKLRLSAKSKGEQYLFDNGRLYFYKYNLTSSYKGNMYGSEYHYVSYYASRCDKIFYDNNLKVGESIKSYDGKTELTFMSDSTEIETPCGKFDGCQLWITEKIGFKSSVYYKCGVGIVYIAVDDMGQKTHCSLKKYNIVGGEGLIPFCEGNIWEYDGGFDPEHCDFEHVFEVISFNGSEAIAASHGFLYRKSYSPDKWEDMILQMRREYHDGNNGLRDVFFPIERAAILAETPYQKAHAAAASNCAKRILESDRNFTPDGKFDGHWNFFRAGSTYFKEGRIINPSNFIYCFEWKSMDGGDAGFPLLGNDILDIIDDVTGCIWCDEWKVGTSMTMKSVDWMKSTTTVTVEHLDSIEVAAGRFEDCLKVNLDIKGDGVSEGLKYRTGKKEYYYAKNIGIVKCVHYFKDGAVVANYELTSYEGTGEGYMPVKDGLVRIYEALGLTEGFIAKAEYTFCDDDGVIKILQNRTGIKERKPYSPDNWEDMITQMRKEYCKSKDGKQILNDVSFPMERALALADTPYRKTLTIAMTDVMKRILEGDVGLTPNGRFTGHWDFFQYNNVNIKDDKIILDGNDRQFSFEWKEMGGTGDSGYPILGNHVLGIVQDAIGCIWSDELKPGMSTKMRGNSYKNTETKVNIENAGTVEVIAGSFDDCLKVTLNITDGWDYRTGKKEYYFARGIGIVKCVHYFKSETLISVYELTAYKGTSDGYMPVKDGLFRRYEAMGLTDGYVSKAEYTFCEDDNGQLKILENNTGIKFKN